MEMESHRNIAKHGHGSHDQQFYTMRYHGYYTVASVGSFATALSLMAGSFKSEEYKTVILVVARNWDWEALFEPYMSSNARYFTRPLAWQYKTSAEPGECAGVRIIRVG